MGIKKAIYPGSFDPIHEGHINLIKKALNLFDEILVVVTNNVNKINHSDIDERVKNVKEKLKGLNVVVIKNENELTANLAQKHEINFLLRGIRNGTDYEYEYEMAKGNKVLNNDLQTIFFFSEEKDKKLSSSIINEIEKYK